jgi:hypothetical protein
MQCFAEEVAPLLARACGGQVRNPDVAPELEPGNNQR